MAETKREKFIRIGNRRVNDVLDGLRLLANLKGPNYDSTREMRDEMVDTIRNALNELESHFAGEKIDKQAFHFTTGLPNGSADGESDIDDTTSV